MRRQPNLTAELYCRLVTAIHKFRCNLPALKCVIEDVGKIFSQTVALEGIIWEGPAESCSELTDCWLCRELVNVSSKSYEDCLQDATQFNNKGGVDRLCSKLGVDVLAPLSLMHGINK